MLMLLASVLSLKISLLSSHCVVAVPPFNCLTTDTHIPDVVVGRQIPIGRQAEVVRYTNKKPLQYFIQFSLPDREQKKKKKTKKKSSII